MKTRRPSDDGYIRAMEQKLHSHRAGIAWLIAAPWLLLSILIIPAAYEFAACDLNPDDWVRLDADFIRLEVRKPTEFMEVREKTYLVTSQGEFLAYRLADELAQSGLDRLEPGTPLQLMLYDGGWRLHGSRMLVGSVSAGGQVFCPVDHILWWQWFDFLLSGGILAVCLAAGILINLFTLKVSRRTQRELERKIARRKERNSKRRTSET